MSQNKKLGTEVQTEYRKSGNASTPKASFLCVGHTLILGIHKLLTFWSFNDLCAYDMCAFLCWFCVSINVCLKYIFICSAGNWTKNFDACRQPFTIVLHTQKQIFIFEAQPTIYHQYSLVSESIIYSLYDIFRIFLSNI
jgi:hypothetical protein